MKVVSGSRICRYMAIVGIFLIMSALVNGMAGCVGTTVVEIENWYDLRNIRNNLGGSYALMNDLDSTSPGYQRLASPTANGGMGWQPIGDWDAEFNGSFDGQGYEIRDLFTYYTDLDTVDSVGLFGYVGDGGRINDLGIVNTNITGYHKVGGLVGENEGTINNSYSTGCVTGNSSVGGLVGDNDSGSISNSYSICNVNGQEHGIGGLVGRHRDGTVRDCYSSGNVNGEDEVGGLLGSLSFGAVIDSYHIGNVTGNGYGVGGLVGLSWYGTVNSCHSTGSVTGKRFGIGGLVGGNVESDVIKSYSSANVIGSEYVGGLVGQNGDYEFSGTVMYSYATGSVTGDHYVGGLVGENHDTVADSYSSGNVTGDDAVGGLVGQNHEGTVTDSFWDIETSGYATSDGGTGKNTTGMLDITTFSVAGWNIIPVALNETNPAYIWNIVNNVTYPFLGWQS